MQQQQPKFQLLRNENASVEARCLQALTTPLQRFCYDFLLMDLFAKVNPGNIDMLKLQISNCKFFNCELAKKDKYQSAYYKEAPANVGSPSSSASSSMNTVNAPSSPVSTNPDIPSEMKNAMFAREVGRWLFDLFFVVTCNDQNKKPNSDYWQRKENSSSSGSSNNNNNKYVPSFEDLIMKQQQSTNANYLATVAEHKARYRLNAEHHRSITEYEKTLLPKISLCFDLIRELIVTLSKSKYTKEQASILRKEFVNSIQQFFGRRHENVADRDFDRSLHLLPLSSLAVVIGQCFRVGIIARKIVTVILFQLVDDLEARGYGDDIQGPENYAMGDLILFHLVLRHVYKKLLDDEPFEMCEMIHDDLLPRVEKCGTNMSAQTDCIDNIKTNVEAIIAGTIPQLDDDDYNDNQDPEKNSQKEEEMSSKMTESVKNRLAVESCLDNLKNNFAGYFYTNPNELRQNPLELPIRLPLVNPTLRLQATLIERISALDDHDGSLMNAIFESDQQKMKMKNGTETKNSNQKNPMLAMTPKQLRAMAMLKENATRLFDEDLQAIDFFRQALEHRKEQALRLSASASASGATTANTMMNFKEQVSMSSSSSTPTPTSPINQDSAAGMRKSSSFADVVGGNSNKSGTSTPANENMSRSSTSASFLNNSNSNINTGSARKGRGFDPTRKNDDDSDSDDDVFTPVPSPLNRSNKEIGSSTSNNNTTSSKKKKVKLRQTLD